MKGSESGGHVVVSWTLNLTGKKFDTIYIQQITIFGVYKVDYRFCVLYFFKVKHTFNKNRTRNETHSEREKRKSTLGVW